MFKKHVSACILLQLLVLFVSVHAFSAQPVSARDSVKLIRKGFIPKDKIFELVYVPFEVPEGTTEIRVKESYDNMPLNVLNMGVYDAKGYQDTAGFRGWSGGAKKDFFIKEADASTGYIPGRIYPGIWNVLVYPSGIAPEGLNWTLEITLVSGKQQKIFELMPAAQQINAVPGWYRGDLHMHTLHSDGRRTVEELVTEAKDKKLDYIISTEHNTNAANLSWGKYNSDQLLIINGEEVTSTKYGHWNAIGLDTKTLIDWRYAPEDHVIQKHIKKVHEDGGLAIINHPFYDKGDKTFQYDEKEFDGIEIWNGEWNVLNAAALKWWDDLLRKGIKKIAIGASDTHKASGSPNNLGIPQTVVFAKGLAKDAILEGIRKGKVYIAGNDEISLELSVSSGGKTVGIGEQLPVDGAVNAELHMVAKGCDNAVLTVIGDKGILGSTKLSGKVQTADLKIKRKSSSYIRVEIRNAEGKMLALTNPVWF
jgi:cytoskeletal protein CcmA (bactofilin family)